MTPFNRTYITGTSSFLPGEAVDNKQMDLFIGSINKMSGRMKNRILAENGIRLRHYAIDQNGRSLHTVASMGAQVMQDLVSSSAPADFLAAATTGGDSAAPGLANMIQGELHLPPMETLSVSGICAASIGALNAAALAVEHGDARYSVALASEFPSRLFKASRFQHRDSDVDFDAHFLRWMLSDGAGGAILCNTPVAEGLSLKLRWIHQKSFSGDMPTCMQVGLSIGNTFPGYLDYPNLGDAEKAGAFDLRQNIRILPNLFDFGLHEYAQLVNDGYVDPSQISWFLCHYSSERFKPLMARLMEEAGIAISEEKWFSNLATKGNTGSASIFIMLDEFFRSKKNTLRPGDQIFGFVPESGRFSVAYFLLEVVEGSHEPEPATFRQSDEVRMVMPPPPISPHTETGDTGRMLRQLMHTWHRYRSEVFRTPLTRSIVDGSVTTTDYLSWMESWIPQVREGSLWMRRAVSSMGPELKDLANLVQLHAGEEHLDWQVLYGDYLNAGGLLPARQLNRNPGGEALNAFMHAYASQPDPIGLLGGIYIIEGTGQRIVPSLLPRLKEKLGFSSSALKFIEYHGENDQAHMLRWLSAVKLVAGIRPGALQDIVQVAETVSELYLQQWKYIK